MTDSLVEAFVILLAQQGSQAAAASHLNCAQASVSRQLKAARAALGDARVLELLQAHQRDEKCGLTLRKPFVMSTQTCGVCGGAKVKQPSGRWRCNACRQAMYRAAHPLAPVENPLTPQEAATKFLIQLAGAGNQAAAAAALGVSKSVVSNRLTKARQLLGDESAIALLTEHQRDAGCGRNLLKTFYLNSPVCRNCGHEKKRLPSNGELVCSNCQNQRNREYKRRHPERISAAAADYRSRNHEVLLAKHRAYRAENPDLDAVYYLANAEQIKARTSAYAKANSAELAARSRHRWLTDESFRQAARARLRAWKKRYPDRVNADTARRQLRLRQAYVSWADDTLIGEFYALARLRTLMTGIPWEVDHIVPLNSDLVCGLHWEGNLQVIPAAANLAKSNDWWPDMPDAPAPLAAFATQPSLYLVVPTRTCPPAPASAAANDEEIRHAHQISRGGRA